MPNDDQTTTVEYDQPDPQTCSFVPPGPFFLDEGNSLTVSFSGFPEGSTFTLLTLQSKKDPQRAVHYPAQHGDTPGIYSISSVGEQPPTELKITITDIEKPISVETYELSLTGDIGPGQGTWACDPEVINKPGG